MLVKASQAGYFGSYRQAGDEFEVPAGTTGSWFKPVKTEPEAEAPKRGRPAKTDGE